MAARKKLKEVRTSLELEALNPFTVLLLGNSEHPELAGVAVQKVDGPDNAWTVVGVSGQITTGDLARLLHDDPTLDTAFVVFEGIEDPSVWGEVIAARESDDEAE